MNINDEILARIKSTEELLDKVKDKTTYAYLEGCYSLKCDYEAINDLDNACRYADIVIDLLQHNKVEYRDNQETRDKVNKMWVTSY